MIILDVDAEQNQFLMLFQRGDGIISQTFKRSGGWCYEEAEHPVKAVL